MCPLSAPFTFFTLSAGWSCWFAKALTTILLSYDSNITNMLTCYCNLIVVFSLAALEFAPKASPRFSVLRLSDRFFCFSVFIMGFAKLPLCASAIQYCINTRSNVFSILFDSSSRRSEKTNHGCNRSS